VGEALAFLHRNGLTHRDVKPGNILVSESGRALLSDFGLAAQRDDPTGTGAMLVLGTPRYVSPEQAMGLPLDARTDVFSLGTVLFEALTGQSPFTGATVPEIFKQLVEGLVPDVRSLNPDVSEATAQVLVKALAKNLDARYPSADEFVIAIRA